MATGEMDVSEQLNSQHEMNKAALGALWREHFGAPPPEQTRRDLIIRILACKIQEQAFGGLTPRFAAACGRLRLALRSYRRIPLNAQLENILSLYLEVAGRWKLTNDDLREQSEKTINFIYELLKEQPTFQKSTP
jgi:hypothetical protein